LIFPRFPQVVTETIIYLIAEVNIRSFPYFYPKNVMFTFAINLHYKDLFDNRYTQKWTVSFLVGPEDLSIKTYFISVPKPTD
ncbi:MAG: hypothetical protein IJQ17_03920, partial [Oscillospiraceae bacterium]|nr:hypothetical protein [Oscillospiraceae bacterium]